MARDQALCCVYPHALKAAPDPPTGKTCSARKVESSGSNALGVISSLSVDGERGEGCEVSRGAMCVQSLQLSPSLMDVD